MERLRSNASTHAARAPNAFSRLLSVQVRTSLDLVPQSRPLKRLYDVSDPLIHLYRSRGIHRIWRSGACSGFGKYPTPLAGKRKWSQSSRQEPRRILAPAERLRLEMEVAFLRMLCSERQSKADTIA